MLRVGGNSSDESEASIPLEPWPILGTTFVKYSVYRGSRDNDKGLVAYSLDTRCCRRHFAKLENMGV